MILPAYIVRQLGHPNGFLGRFILWQLNKSNQIMNDATYEALKITAEDRVLEIGFGGGALLGNILLSTPAFVAGLEKSEMALQRMLKRHRAKARNGSMKLVKTESDSIPFSTNSFSKVCCVNVVYFWDDPAAVIGEVHRVLQEGGKFVICYELSSPDQREFSPQLIEPLLERAGFADIATQAGDQDDNEQFFCTTAS